MKAWSKLYHIVESSSHCETVKSELCKTASAVPLDMPFQRTPYHVVPGGSPVKVSPLSMFEDESRPFILDDATGVARLL